MAIGALDDNGTRHVHLGQHLVDFGDGERGEEGIVVEFLLVRGIVGGIQIDKGLRIDGCFRTDEIADENVPWGRATLPISLSALIASWM